jgi:hypothetical protein
VPKKCLLQNIWRWRSLSPVVDTHFHGLCPPLNMKVISR